MFCPKCKKDNDIVIDSRPYLCRFNYRNIHMIRRRRKCLSCDYRFTTLEADLNFLSGLNVNLKAKRQEKE